MMSTSKTARWARQDKHRLKTRHNNFLREGASPLVAWALDVSLAWPVNFAGNGFGAAFRALRSPIGQRQNKSIRGQKRMDAITPIVRGAPTMMHWGDMPEKYFSSVKLFTYT